MIKGQYDATPVLNSNKNFKITVQLFVKPPKIDILLHFLPLLWITQNTVFNDSKTSKIQSFIYLAKCNDDKLLTKTESIHILGFRYNTKNTNISFIFSTYTYVDDKDSFQQVKFTHMLYNNCVNHQGDDK